MLTFASRLCFVAAIGLLVWAGMWMVVSGNAAPTREALVIEEPEQDIGKQPTGVHTVEFRMRNTSDQPQRVIGFAEG